MPLLPALNFEDHPRRIAGRFESVVRFGLRRVRLGPAGVWFGRVWLESGRVGVGSVREPARDGRMRESARSGESVRGRVGGFGAREAVAGSRLKQGRWFGRACRETDGLAVF